MGASRITSNVKKQEAGLQCGLLCRLICPLALIVFADEVPI